MRVISAALAALAVAAPACSQTTAADPFPDPIPATEGVIRVSFSEFAVLPDLVGVPARMMLILDEPGTQRLFVNDMRGPLYRVSYDGRSVVRYLDINASTWGVKVQSQGRERGFQSFAFHPQFAQPGTPGFGKLYTWTDAEPGTTADFHPGGGNHTHDTVLLEWTARNTASAVYDGAPPRELLRIEQPFANHNGGRMAFNPLAGPGDADYGLLYVGLADGGSAGDPLNNAQNLGSPFGKILRINPLGSNSANGRYGIPTANPFAADSDSTTLGEIFVYGIRNTQHFTWDRTTRRMIISDIGQNTVEELDVVAAGENLGWNVWEGSFRYGRGGVITDDPRSDPAVTYPFVEYAQADSLFMPQSAITGLAVYRSAEIPQLKDVILFGDLPSGEIFWVPADDLPNGGQSPIHRVLLNQGGEARTLLEVIKTKNIAQGKSPATRADLRLHPGPEGRVFLLDKADGVIRVLVPDGE